MGVSERLARSWHLTSIEAVVRAPRQDAHLVSRHRQPDTSDLGWFIETHDWSAAVS